MVTRGLGIDNTSSATVPVKEASNAGLVLVPESGACFRGRNPVALPCVTGFRPRFLTPDSGTESEPAFRSTVLSPSQGLPYPSLVHECLFVQLAELSVSYGRPMTAGFCGDVGVVIVWFAWGASGGNVDWVTV